MIVAGHLPKLKTGVHSRVMGTVGDLYLTVADEIMGAGLGKFPTASQKMGEIVA
jgi:hypothetical protein